MCHSQAVVPVVSAPQVSETVSETVVDPNSLFSRLGGSAAVEAAVNLFYKKVLDDVELKPFFAGISMIDQRAKQVREGGPCRFWIARHVPSETSVMTGLYSCLILLGSGMWYVFAGEWYVFAKQCSTSLMYLHASWSDMMA